MAWPSARTSAVRRSCFLAAIWRTPSAGFEGMSFPELGGYKRTFVYGFVDYNPAAMLTHYNI